MAVTAAQVAAYRESIGLPPDPESDAIWASRPWATMSDVSPRLDQKAATTYSYTSGTNYGIEGDFTGTSSDPNFNIGTRGGGDFTYGGDTSGVRQENFDQNLEDEVAARFGGASLFDTQALPDELRRAFLEAYLETGDQTLALIEMRRNPAYDVYFPGNKRDDGTLRFTEAEYQAVTEAFDDALFDNGANPAMFQSKYGDLIASGKSPNEFRQQIEALSERFVNAPPEQLEAFGREFGITNPTATQAFAVALDPTIGQEVLERRLNIAELTGTAAQFGFSRSRSRVSQFVSQGVTAQQARQFYSSAATAVPTLSGIAGRANTGPFGVTDLEGAALLSDPVQRQRLERLQRREQSLFSRSATTVQSQGGALSGLRRR